MIQEEIDASTKKGTIVSPEAIYERLFRIHIFYTVSRTSQNIWSNKVTEVKHKFIIQWSQPTWLYWNVSIDDDYLTYHLRINLRTMPEEFSAGNEWQNEIIHHQYIDNIIHLIDIPKCQTSFFVQTNKHWW